MSRRDHDGEPVLLVPMVLGPTLRLRLVQHAHLRAQVRAMTPAELQDIHRRTYGLR